MCDIAKPEPTNHNTTAPSAAPDSLRPWAATRAPQRLSDSQQTTSKAAAAQEPARVASQTTIPPETPQGDVRTGKSDAADDSKTPNAKPQATTGAPRQSSQDSGKATKPREAPRKVRYQPQADQDDELKHLQDLAAAAKKGDSTALDKLREALDALPHVWQRIADLGRLAEESLADAMYGDDLLHREAMLKRGARMRSEASLPDDSLLVQMAVSRVTIAWLFCQCADLQILKYPSDPHAGRFAADLERRYKAAVQTLTHLRKHEAQLKRFEAISQP